MSSPSWVRGDNDRVAGRPEDLVCQRLAALRAVAPEYLSHADGRRRKPAPRRLVVCQSASVDEGAAAATDLQDIARVIEEPELQSSVPPEIAVARAHHEQERVTSQVPQVRVTK